jgi:glycosyl transferase family 25
MNNLLEYFGAAFLINLPKRTDRLRSAKKELARAGWTLGPGGVQLYAAETFTDRAGFPFPGSRGCFHSHAVCLRKAYSEGKKSVLMIEDDVAFSPAIRRLTPSIIAQLESGPWDFFYLGHEFTGDIPRATSRTTDVKLAPITTEIRTTHCYAVNARIFERLLAHLDRVAKGREGDQEFGPMPIDGAFNIFRRYNPDVRGFITSPKISWQRSSRSDNHPHFFDHFQPLRPFVSALRNLKYATERLRF